MLGDKLEVINQVSELCTQSGYMSNTTTVVLLFSIFISSGFIGIVLGSNNS